MKPCQGIIVGTLHQLTKTLTTEKGKSLCNCSCSLEPAMGFQINTQSCRPSKGYYTVLLLVVFYFTFKNCRSDQCQYWCCQLALVTFYTHLVTFVIWLFFFLNLCCDFLSLTLATVLYLIQLSSLQHCCWLYQFRQQVQSTIYKA